MAASFALTLLFCVLVEQALRGRSKVQLSRRITSSAFVRGGRGVGVCVWMGVGGGRTSAFIIALSFLLGKRANCNYLDFESSHTLCQVPKADSLCANAVL